VKQTRESGWIMMIGLPLLLLVLYVGAYYATVRATPRTVGGKFVPTTRSGGGEFVPGYSLPLDRGYEWGPRIAQLFAPIHWVDRFLRPDDWKP
jgi:hypothetical protein